MEVLKKALASYIKNPYFILIFIIQYIILSLFTFNSLIKFTNPISEFSYFALMIILFILVSSFFLSIFIGSSHLALENKFKLKSAFSFYKKTWGNFLLIVFLTLLAVAIFFLAKFVGDFVYRRTFGDYAFYISAGIFILGFFLLVFLSFQSFFYIIKNQKIIPSIKNSIILVSKNYFKVILILILFLFLDFLTSLIPNSLLIIKHILYYIVLYPLTILSLTELFESLTKENKK